MSGSSLIVRERTYTTFKEKGKSIFKPYTNMALFKLTSSIRPKHKCEDVSRFKLTVNWAVMSPSNSMRVCLTISHNISFYFLCCLQKNIKTILWGFALKLVSAHTTGGWSSRELIYIKYESWIGMFPNTQMIFYLQKIIFLSTIVN